MYIYSKLIKRMLKLNNQRPRHKKKHENMQKYKTWCVLLHLNYCMQYYNTYNKWLLEWISANRWKEGQTDIQRFKLTKWQTVRSKDTKKKDSNSFRYELQTQRINYRTRIQCQLCMHIIHASIHLRGDIFGREGWVN